MHGCLDLFFLDHHSYINNSIQFNILLHSALYTHSIKRNVYNPTLCTWYISWSSKLNKYLRKFTTIKVSHKLELVLPILNYGCETWGFHTGTALERVQLHFCKQLLGVKNVLKMISFTVIWNEHPCKILDMILLLSIGLKYYRQIPKDTLK